MATSRRDLLKGVGAAAVLAEISHIRRLAAQPADDTPAERYSLDPAVTYLNHASIGTVPRVVQEAHRRYLELCETNPWLYMWSEPWTEPREAVRTLAANLLGCESDELAILHNTTECFNTLAHGLPLGAADEVLFSSLNHAGASVCWDHVAKRQGFKVRQFDFPLARIEDATEDSVVEIYADAMGPQTRVLVLPHVDNMVGLRHPVARIAEVARARGVRWVAVDGAQTVNMIPVDVGALGVDVYATSAHKWTQSPKGLGFAYLSREIQQDLEPMWVTWGQKWSEGSARIYEDYGTRALPSVLALGDALEFQAAVPMAEREAHHQRLRQELLTMVENHDSLRWRSPTRWGLGAALYALEVVAGDGAEIAHRLFADHGIVVRPFALTEFDALRVSPNLANGTEDLRRLIAAVK